MTGIFSGAFAKGAFAAEAVTVIAVAPTRAATQVVCNKRFQVFIGSPPSGCQEFIFRLLKKASLSKIIIH
jgi:hypothetical protein